MAENAFSAIRISLASPDQIHAWSYGEVTKPETINYRNQKPEKDGLFDERIFGPTKDFECYCGKYKRIRYRGVICDRCGVEVTRAKVRRERMGHINLAAPVAHIWFAKGTPSWLGLLLDMSPRNLERVLYYAQYVVTSVNEDVRKELLESFEKDEGEAAITIETAVEQAIAAVRREMDEKLAEIGNRRETTRDSIEAKIQERHDVLRQEAETLRTSLQESMGSKPGGAKKLADRTIVARGKVIEGSHIEALDSTLQELMELASVEVAGDSGREAEKSEGDEEQITSAAAEEVARIQKGAKERADEIRKGWDERRGDVEDIAKLQPLTENRYREMRDAFPVDLFTAGMGAEALLQILADIDLETLREALYLEATTSTSGQRAKKAAKRLRVVEGFRKSSNRADWMILTVLPVLPPDLRPMVQLDGGRFATSDLNDLYRRVINRNNRLKRLIDLGAPEIIVRNEKRMLQEAVDALIDNGRRGRALTGSHNHKLKSLSDMLRGKQGRFRQNLLGKRVDYSGRSVIVVGSTLKLHQCGLPKKMALELFKPFVMNRLVTHGMAPNIRSAKRMVDRVRPEVWDLLEEVIKERPVFLNRAPTLHRLGIQAFEPVLVEGSAIQIHPLVCSAYNADFDGDQMAVHVPIGQRAVLEARELMLSTHNMLLPSSGEPVVAPTLDIVVGCYYLTTVEDDTKGTGQGFVTFDDAKLAYDLGQIDLRAEISVRSGVAVAEDGRREVLLPRLRTTDEGATGVVDRTPFQPVIMRKDEDETEDIDDSDQVAVEVEAPEPVPYTVESLKTSVGRIIFNEVLPADVAYRNDVIDKKSLKDVVTECYEILSNEETAVMLDAIKRIGFHFATESGLTIALNDVNVPPEKEGLLEVAEGEVETVQRSFQRGLLTEDELEERIIGIWQSVNGRMEEIINERLHEYGNLYLMAGSGAKGNIAQIKQMAGMRGLMADPKGKILPLPIKSSFREGLTVLEYFISTHGARKGLADTALRTADSGYLTRRLIDVAQDTISKELDCGTLEGIWLDSATLDPMLGTLAEHIIGRLAAAAVAHPKTGELIVDRNDELSKEVAEEIFLADITRVYVRSPLTCAAPRGMCRNCYGRSLARGKLVDDGEAIGIIAAQSIGEPGTQLTMRTFHTGGVAGVDITSGLPRVEELFEARVPKFAVPMSEIDGLVEVIDDAEGRRVRVVNEDVTTEEYILPEGYELLAAAGVPIKAGDEIARPAGETETEGGLPAPASIRAPMDGLVSISGSVLTLTHTETTERTYPVLTSIRLLVASGQRIGAGTPLAEGPLNPQEVLRIKGKDAVQRYLVAEVQKVYRSQGVVIHDKHIEIIARQMLRRVRIDSAGDTEFLQGELVDRFMWQSVNAKVLAEGGEPSTAQTVLLGVTKVSLSTDSFLAAASFQETTRVLTEAALFGKVDRLLGLKENVIIGRLIPAQSAAGKSLGILAEPAATAIADPFGFGEESGEESENTEGTEANDAFSTEAVAGAISEMSDEPASRLNDLEEEIDMSAEDDEDDDEDMEDSDGAETASKEVT